MWGVYAYSEKAFDPIPGGFDVSQSSPFSALVAQKDARFVFLLVVKPYDTTLATSATAPRPMAAGAWADDPTYTVLGGERTFRFSDVGFVSRASDTPAHTNYAPRLSGEESYVGEFTAFDGDEPTGIGGEGVGSIEILNPDGAHDALADLVWSGREVQILAGGPDFALADFEPIFTGTARGVALSEAGIRIEARDRRLLLERPIQSSTYGGTGGLDGDADLEGQIKPLTYGRVRNMEPRAIDRGNLVYQVHDGSVNAIDTVRDQGVKLVLEGDTTDILGTTVSIGRYKTDTSRGLLRLGGTPAGRITCDVEGDNTGGYVSRTADIIQRIATTRGGLNDEELALVSFVELNGRFGAVVGLHIADDRRVGDVFTQIMAAAAGFWLFTRAGRLALMKLRAPFGPIATLEDKDVLDVERSTPGVRSWRRRVGYKRMWNVLGDDDFAGAVSDADRALLSNRVRFKEARDDPVRGATRGVARDREFETLLDTAEAASAEAAGQKTLFNTARHVWRVAVPRALFRFWLGDMVRLKLARYGQESGHDLVVIGVRESAASDETELSLWG